jgi:hypothetical protein
MNRRTTWSVITYGDLGGLLNHPARGMGQILDRVGRWCRSIGKRSLSLLVIDEKGKPRDGMFGLPGQIEQITPESYEQQRVRLWREDWTGVSVPTLEQIAEANAAGG